MDIKDVAVCEQKAYPILHAGIKYNRKAILHVKSGSGEPGAGLRLSYKS